MVVIYVVYSMIIVMLLPQITYLFIMYVKYLWLRVYGRWYAYQSKLQLNDALFKNPYFFGFLFLIKPDNSFRVKTRHK